MRILGPGCTRRGPWSNFPLKLTDLSCHGAGWRQRRARPARSLTMR
jgi:hypothetical protein